ncbi:MAG: phosphate ABC transporter permease PstA [Halalkalicoccus sp.]|nr:phosphate ABC transporter permease PstA [Halalkalicoccus sp.]
MAAEEPTGLRRNAGLRFEQLKGGLFEALLIGATLVGILSLLVLFGYLAFDAFRPLTASAGWYLLYFGTLVAPSAAFTLYARRRPAVRAANARAFAVVFGCLAVGLLIYVVVNSLSPYDVLIYVLFGAVPPVLVRLYGRETDSRLTGPAIPVSIVLGLALAAGLYGVLRPLVGWAARWVAYTGIVTLPVAAILGAITTRRRSRRAGALVAAAVLGVTLAVAVGALATGRDPSLWVVLTSAFVLPVGYVVGETALTEEEGRTGLIGPFVVIGGVLLGAVLARRLGIQGPEGFLTPTLLLNSWDGLTASNAGVYPQIVGSIVIVGFMSIMAFPVGIGAAVYLEEYAPKTGPLGRLATLLEVNISNLAGVPSVVYGLLGLALFRNTLGFGTGVVIAAAGTLGFLILPIVVVSTQEAIRAVPNSLREASYGMGASRWQVLRGVVLPRAVPGVLTGTILSLARAIGETAPLVIIAVATTTYTPPSGLFSSATALPLQIFAARSNVDVAFRHGIVPAAAVVLLALMLVMNASAVVVRNRFEREH